MRILLVVIALAASVWSGYWWMGSSAKETAITTWLDERRDDGWVAEYASLDLEGYPNRFDTKISDFFLSDPVSGWAWSAPEFQILALSYQPNHIIAVWPRDQLVSGPGQRITIQSDEMRSSVKFDPDTGLALNTATMTLAKLVLTSTAGWESEIEKAVFATRQSEIGDFAHDIAFDATNFVPAAIFKKRIDPKGRLPAAFDQLHIETTAAFDAPWDRAAIEDVKPELKRLDLNNVKATWGALDLQAKGSLNIDAHGYPQGKIAVRAKNWREMLELAVQAGAVSNSLASSLESGLKLLARLSGAKETLNVPLKFSGRKIYLGPIPIGKSPRLSLN